MGLSETAKWIVLFYFPTIRITQELWNTTENNYQIGAEKELIK